MSNKMITKTLYIAVEIMDRELGGGILLAAEAVSRGWQVVLAGKQGIFANMTRFKKMPGIFYLKSIVPGEIFKQKELMNYGHRVVSLDVEGLVPSNGESGVRLRFSDKSIELADLVFFWGQDHYASVSAVYPSVKEKAVVSGSPIIDEVLVRGKRAREKKTSKKKILIGTSCGYANHINGIEFARKMTQDAYSQNLVEGGSVAEFEHEALLDEKMFAYWKETVPRISESFSNCDVVLRPHPNENKQFWKSYLKQYKNIRVDEGRSILEEMLGSDVYVHFNSTSSLTAMILGIPTFMPLPQMQQELLDRITFVKDISITAPTADELIAKITQFMGGAGKGISQADISRYCINLKETGSTASQRIMDALEQKFQFSAHPEGMVPQELKERVVVALKKFKFFLMWSAGIAMSAVGIKPGKKFPPRNAYVNAHAKQPPVSLNRVKYLMSELLDSREIGRIDIEQIATNLFVMKQRGAP